MRKHKHRAQGGSSLCLWSFSYYGVDLCSNIREEKFERIVCMSVTFVERPTELFIELQDGDAALPRHMTKDGMNRL